jgi:hypothetical protein
MTIDQGVTLCRGKLGHRQVDISARDSHIGQRQAPDQAAERRSDVSLYAIGEQFKGAQHAQTHPSGPVLRRKKR